MDPKEWQTKAPWNAYEASLWAKGFEPCYDPDTEQRIQAAAVRCCKCGATPAYIGMTKGTTQLGFIACPPECGEWFFFMPGRALVRPPKSQEN